MIKLENLISNADDSVLAVKLYAEFVSELYLHGDNFSEFIYNFAMEDENFYIKAKSKGIKLDKVIENALENELTILQNLSQLRSSELKGFVKYYGFLPDWNTSSYDFISAYRKRIKNASKHGFGMFSKYHVFTILDDNIVPVKYPDSQSLESLACYEREREIVVKNTLRLLEGHEASNILLYGDAGTGKSSTVKAIVNRYMGDGLRLVEVKKHQLHKLPDIMEQLAETPLKFIIFIDDLSFMENDDNFTALKALLEGSVTVRSKNVVIYTTINRLHLLKEQFSSRGEDDEIHINDTLQEIMSLSARFGITVTFERPDKDTYLQIVKQIALEYGVPVDEQLFTTAEAFAIRHNGRSPRAAKQFIEIQKSGL
jgi:predicted AAA+ superfamily ATPase